MIRQLAGTVNGAAHAALVLTVFPPEGFPPEGEEDPVGGLPARGARDLAVSLAGVQRGGRQPEDPWLRGAKALGRWPRFAAGETPRPPVTGTGHRDRGDTAGRRSPFAGHLTLAGGAAAGWSRDNGSDSCGGPRSAWLMVPDVRP